MLALFPLTLGIGEGAALRAPLAVAVIGGLVTSTLLTLVVIPAAYRILGGSLRLREEKV
ncbi:MAG: efflux RND transporter permease subunit [Gammaproteobacteria bacterium]|nr:efflux RND transporter permease subunit [Gammaproteobacteria bacterium]